MWDFKQFMALTLILFDVILVVVTNMDEILESLDYIKKLTG